MPRPSTKVCPKPGCPQLQPCPTHKPTPWAGSTRRNRLPADWDSRRQAVLERDGHRCTAATHHPRCTGRATDVDHIERGDNHELANLTSLSAECHKAKTQREAAIARAASRAHREG